MRPAGAFAAASLAMAASSAAAAGPRAAASGPIDRLVDVIPAIAACWRAPAGLRGLERTDVTARFALRRDGALVGPPRVTFATDLSETARALLTRSGIAAIRDCTPVRLTDGLGAAIAGRPLTIRFTHDGPKGRGI